MMLNSISNVINSPGIIPQIIKNADTPPVDVHNKLKLSRDPDQVNRTVEISKDPPVTILKFTNESTKQVELQIPSEVSLRVYKSNIDFINRVYNIKNTVNIKA